LQRRRHSRQELVSQWATFRALRRVQRTRYPRLCAAPAHSSWQPAGERGLMRPGQESIYNEGRRAVASRSFGLALLSP
ncbi:MAG TPA: hypothetical protein VG963_26465, partial [Polyangiaceae bacterium]|nr:hypothetical protein [Polyangiaceae bacterium]